MPQDRLYLFLRVVSGFAFSLIITYELVYHTETVGLNPLQLVLVGVVLETMTLLGEVPTGIVADSVSRRLSVLIGLFLIGLGFLTEGIWTTYAAVIAAQILWGIGFTFYSGAAEAWITDEIGEEAAAPLFLKAVEWGQWANLSGIAAASLLVTVDIRLPIISGAILYIVLAGGLVFFMREDGFASDGPGENSLFKQVRQTAAKGFELTKSRPMIRTILLVGMVIGLSIGGFDRLYVAHFLENFTLPPLPFLAGAAWFGILRAIVAVGTIIGSRFLRLRFKISDQQTVIKILGWAYGGMIVLTLMFIFSGQFAMAAAAFCLSQTLRFVTRPLIIIWINANAPSAVRATAISLYWQANGLGQIVGNPFVGWLGTVRSLRAALTAGALVYVAAPLLLWRAHHQFKSRSS